MSLFNVGEGGSEVVVKYLMEHKNDPDNGNKKGETLLFNACSNGNESLVKCLVELLGADIHKENFEGETPLFNACTSGNEAIGNI